MPAGQEVSKACFIKRKDPASTKNNAPFDVLWKDQQFYTAVSRYSFIFNLTLESIYSQPMPGLFFRIFWKSSIYASAAIFLQLLSVWRLRHFRQWRRCFWNQLDCFLNLAHWKTDLIRHRGHPCSSVRLDQLCNWFCESWDWVPLALDLNFRTLTLKKIQISKKK